MSNDPRFFFGSDSAPHLVSSKENAPGAAGIFNVPTAIPYVTQVFEEEAALDKLERFLSINGARFYQLPINSDTKTLKKVSEPVSEPIDISIGSDKLRVFGLRDPLLWTVRAG